jgi:hypothetical protein
LESVVAAHKIVHGDVKNNQ